MQAILIVITIIIAIMLLNLIALTWSKLGNIDNKTKTISIIVGIVMVYIITFIIFNISKIGIIYEDPKVMKTIRSVFVMLFTIINSYALLPYFFKKINQINNDEIQKNEFQRSLIILLIIIVTLFIFESIYFGNTQQRILAMK